MNTIIFLKVGVVHNCLEAWKTIFVIVDSVSFYEDLIICSLNNILNMADSVTTVVFLYVKYNSVIESWCPTIYMIPLFQPIYVH